METKKILKAIKNKNEQKARAKQQTPTAAEKGTPLAQDWHEAITLEEPGHGWKIALQSSIYSIEDLIELTLQIRKEVKKNNGAKGTPGYAG